MTDKIKTLFDGTPSGGAVPTFKVGKGRFSFVAADGLQGSDEIVIQIALSLSPSESDWFDWFANGEKQVLNANHNATMCLVPAVHRANIPDLAYPIKVVSYGD